MPNILRRPMFKLGGSSSDGVGITSGFRKNYSIGGNEWIEEIDWNNLGGSKGIYEAMGKAIGPTMEAMKGAGKMDNYELAMMISDVAGKGGSISDMVTNTTTSLGPFVDRYKKTQASLGPAAFNMLGTMGGLAAKSEAANKKTATEIRLDASTTARQMAADAGGAANLTGADLDKYNALQKIALQSGFLTPQEALAEAATLAPDIVGEKWEDYSDQRKLEIINNIALGLRANTGKLAALRDQNESATGGRVGRNIGGSMQTDMVAENIQTPGGDVEVAAAETMQAPTPSQDPYILLRARLPREITDDVVRLIATNPEAFKDFAAIETQEDVIDFNATYGVELVLPAQQV